MHAGAGGVGIAAIQLGKAVGARVIATAGGPREGRGLPRLGADQVIDYGAEDFVRWSRSHRRPGRRRDLRPGRRRHVRRSRRCIAFEGRLLVVGFAGGRIPERRPTRLMKNYSVVGLHWGLYRKHDPALVPAGPRGARTAGPTRA